jgi:hypothetical protein
VCHGPSRGEYHLRGEYAEEVVGALLDPSFTAIAPSRGLDPVALAAHAKLAVDRRRERDRSLRYCAHKRLEQLAEGNTVVFGGYHPFVGCGITLDSWTICIEVAAAGIHRGGTGGVNPFDALELHEHLLRTVPPQTPGGLRAAHRLFVGGMAATGVPGLIPDPRYADTWPASRLPADVLDRFTREPSEAARTYACLALPAWPFLPGAVRSSSRR